MTSKAQQLLESYKDAELFRRDVSQKDDPLSHHYSKVLSHHLELADGKNPKFRSRAKAVLRHFVKWQEAATVHKEKHKKIPDMDDLAAQKPKAIKSWQHYRRHVAPKERRYHKEVWLLNQEVEHHNLEKGTQ